MSEITEGIWKHATSFFNYFGSGTLAVYRICPICSRFVTKGRVHCRLECIAQGQVRLEGWTCSRCGEVEPSYEWVDV